MTNLSGQPIFEFRRRNDTSTYRYQRYDPINGFPAWKRENADLYVIQHEGFGWVCVDIVLAYLSAIFLFSFLPVMQSQIQ